MPSGVPGTVHQRRIPQRFRSRMLHVEDPVLVLREFIDWLERAPARPDDADDAKLAELEMDRADLAARCQRLERDRRQLVLGLIELTDLLDSPALHRRATDTLAGAGVQAIDSAGERFDPKRHRAVERVDTANPDSDGLIVETARLGYDDRGQRARLPDVLVYHHDGAGIGG
jgi:hypothetical protein